MKHYFLKNFLLSVVLLYSCCFSANAQTDYYKILSITNSIASGGRGGSTQYVYTMDSIKIIRTKIESYNGKYNQTSDTSSVDPAYWQELNKYLDLDYFFEMSERNPGCLNCADEGVAYIEITTPIKKYHVSFNPSSSGMRSFAERLPDPFFK